MALSLAPLFFYLQKYLYCRHTTVKMLEFLKQTKRIYENRNIKWRFVLDPSFMGTARSLVLDGAEILVQFSIREFQSE